MEIDEQGLSEPWTMSFSYTRTSGPIVGAFLSGLRDRRILGLRNESGLVQVPPTGYDAQNSRPLDEWVELKPLGQLRSWAWVHTPLPSHPHTRPFAWALVRLEGADSDLLHTLCTDTPGALREGMPVSVRWAEERSGHIRDIECFEPVPQIDSDDAGDASP